MVHRPPQGKFTLSAHMQSTRKTMRKIKKSKKLSKLYLAASGNCSGLSAQEALQEDFSAA